MCVIRRALALLAACAISACAEAPAAVQGARPRPAGEWPNYRGNAALQGVAAGELGAAPELAWTFETEGAITSSPVVAGNTVYVGSGDGSVYAIELATGRKKWSFKTDDIVEAPPLVHAGHVYIGSCDFFFYALNAVTGDVVWKFETGDKILGGANHVRLADGRTRILVGSYDNKLYCFDAEGGKKLWEYETDNYVNGTPAILGDRVVFGGCDAVLHVVSVTTGKAVAKVELGDDCHIAGSVALTGGYVYFGHYGNEFVCVDLATGKTRWSYPSQRHAFFSSPAIGKNRVVFGGRDRRLHCVARGDGKPLWSFLTRKKVDGSPVICGGKVVFGSGDGRLYMLDLRDGSEIWQYEIGRAIYSSPAVVGGMIVIGSNDKRLYAFRTAPSRPGR